MMKKVPLLPLISQVLLTGPQRLPPLRIKVVVVHVGHSLLLNRSSQMPSELWVLLTFYPLSKSLNATEPVSAVVVDGLSMLTTMSPRRVVLSKSLVILTLLPPELPELAHLMRQSSSLASQVIPPSLVRTVWLLMSSPLVHSQYA